MKQHLSKPEIEKYIPLDKSWAIRLGFLDLLHGSSETEEFLATQKELSEDLQALLRIGPQWRAGEPLDVGESGTLFRFLQFAAWKRGEDRQFIKRGTLKHRPLTVSPDITTWPLDRLLELDNGTSQWASAAVLMGNQERQPAAVPYKLGLTYEALEHWQKVKSAKTPLEFRLDETIKRQAEAYLGWLACGQIDFEPLQAEDYCFARAFDLMTPKQAEARWPALRGHESDRITAMETALNQEVVDSNDHRVVQAVAMRRLNKVEFTNPVSVNKSWPAFWLFLHNTLA